MKHVVFAVPGSLDTPTGGYAYDRRIIAELRELGWFVECLDIGDGFPSPDEATRSTARSLLLKVPTGQPIVLPAGIGGVTYEAELAAVIGTRAENVGKDRALDHVVAYGCFNDISASEIIKADGHFDRGKNFANFGPFGPFLASSDEIPDPHALRVTLKVDGTTMQSGSTRDMLFGVAGMHKPPAWLKPGSQVEVEVENLGRLINPIIEGPAADA